MNVVDSFPGTLRIIFLLHALLFSLAIIAETTFLFFRRRSRLDPSESALNIFLFAAFVLIGSASVYFNFWIYSYFHKFKLIDFGDAWRDPSNPLFWSQWIALVFLEDLCFYAHHRVSHSTGFFWAIHSVHHSSAYFNFTTGLRQSWTTFLDAIFWLPLALIGFDPIMILIQQEISFQLQGWTHTEIVGPLGALEYFLNTPTHHQVHHAINTKYLDKNFGGLFIIWDKMFGTYQERNESPVYGVLGERSSKNALVVEFREWARFFRNLRSSIGTK